MEEAMKNRSDGIRIWSSLNLLDTHSSFLTGGTLTQIGIFMWVLGTLPESMKLEGSIGIHASAADWINGIRKKQRNQWNSHFFSRLDQWNPKEAMESERHDGTHAPAGVWICWIPNPGQPRFCCGIRKKLTFYCSSRSCCSSRFCVELERHNCNNNGVWESSMEEAMEFESVGYPI